MDKNNRSLRQKPHKNSYATILLGKITSKVSNSPDLSTQKYGICVTPLCFLRVVIGCCGLMDDGSVQQQGGVIGRNVYWHSAHEIGILRVES